ncbi:hypothetical protein NP493_919g00008 [Ridgeia piscesae]|uniref:Fibronectin type-III domain-containing protein n=1 Tax=Ridgeia piscesae TaxID=27915 RepID=A0AAD9KKJ0_RIDPI|nr:hypothetical protein NP493_919g00008 [Ridgeia piscesae]
MGYKVEYHVSSQSAWLYKTLFDPVIRSLLVDDLELFHTYEFRIRAFNMFGHSGWSNVSVIYLEIAPTGAPRNAAVGTVNSTEISISWQPPTADLQNGDLLGYKVYYWVTGTRETSTAMRRVPAKDTHVTLRELHMYTRYQVTLLAFNAAGDGPNISVPLEARTSEGVPGQPGELQFAALSMTSLNVSWAAPSQPNGIIENYTVSYYEARAKDGISRSVQVTISGDSHSLLVTKLVENVKYVFSVRARTKIDWGETVNGSTTTGPQKGLYHRAPKSVVTKGHRKVYTIGQPKYFVPMGTAEFVPYGHHMTSGRFVPKSYRQIHALSNVAFFH